MTLQFSYGKTLELPSFDWDSYPADWKKHAFHEFVGVDLSYSPESDQYFLLYMASPYYNTDGAMRNESEKTYRIAVFDKQGALVKRFMLTGCKGVPPILSASKTEIGGKYTTNVNENIQHLEPNLYFSHKAPSTVVFYIENQPYMVDIGNEIVVKPTDQQLRSFSVHLPSSAQAKTTTLPYADQVYNAPTQMPYRVTYNNKGTHIILTDSEETITTFPLSHDGNSSASLDSYKTDYNGTSYALFSEQKEG